MQIVVWGVAGLRGASLQVGARTGHSITVARHVRRAFTTLVALQSLDDFVSEAVGWLFAAMAALWDGAPDRLIVLARIARLKAAWHQRHQKAEKTHRSKEWTRWLSGGMPREAGAPYRPSKRAFLFVRGATGWMRSPIAARASGSLEVDGDESDLVEASDIDTAVGCRSRLWRPPHLVDMEQQLLPLCGQEAVEHEAQQWAQLRDEHGEHMPAISVEGGICTSYRGASACAQESHYFLPSKHGTWWRQHHSERGE